MGPHLGTGAWLQSILQGEEKGTAVSQLAERTVRAQRWFPLLWHCRIPPTPLAPPSLTALCQPNYTRPLCRTPCALSCSGAAGHKIMVMSIHPLLRGH